ncbi:hypothetical protein [Spirillospora sp. NPDC047279]
MTRSEKQSPPPAAFLVTNWDDELKAITAGRAVIATAAETTRFYPRSNLV